MTKKHFEAAAAIIRDMSLENEELAKGARICMIQMGKRFNPRFDAERFINACVPTLTKVVKAAQHCVPGGTLPHGSNGPQGPNGPQS